MKNLAFESRSSAPILPDTSGRTTSPLAEVEGKFTGRREYEAALEVLRHHRCPTIEWKIFLAAADTASAYRDVSLAEHYRRRCRSILAALGDSLTGTMRRRFLRCEAVSAAML